MSTKIVHRHLISINTDSAAPLLPHPGARKLANGRRRKKKNRLASEENCIKTVFALVLALCLQENRALSLVGLCAALTHCPFSCSHMASPIFNLMPVMLVMLSVGGDVLKATTLMSTPVTTMDVCSPYHFLRLFLFCPVCLLVCNLLPDVN